VLVSAAVCPHPPLLLPGLTGSADVGAALRAACAEALDEALAAGPDRVVVVGGAATTATWDGTAEVDPSPYGGFGRTPAAGPGARLPLSLMVGRTLLDASSWSGPVALQGIAADSAPADCARLGAALADGASTTLLVMGDGSARRGPKAPGYVDERALTFDDSATRGLSRADVEALAALEPDVAAELLVAGRAAWQVLAGALGHRSAAGRLLLADDPFGVLYLVLAWRTSGGRGEVPG
jgi:hypothetical protein